MYFFQGNEEKTLQDILNCPEEKYEVHFNGGKYRFFSLMTGYEILEIIKKI